MHTFKLANGSMFTIDKSGIEKARKHLLDIADMTKSSQKTRDEINALCDMAQIGLLHRETGLIV